MPAVTAEESRAVFSPITERLIQIVAVVAVLYFGWQLTAQTVLDLVVTKGNLQACRQEVFRLKPPGR